MDDFTKYVLDTAKDATKCYQEGFKAGQASRDKEVASLDKQIKDLEGIIDSM